MRITKAVITAAGPGHRTLPLQRLVDTDGIEKSALEMIIEEVNAAGIDRVALVVRPGDAERYQQAAGRYVDRLHFVVQQQPRGYGDALCCASPFMGDDPVLHLVGDHLYLSRLAVRCSQQLIEVAARERCAVSAVQPTRETMLPYFGAVGGSRLAQTEGLYEIRRVIEKPTPTQAEQELTVAGFRSGTYLCFFGMHVLTPTVMTILREKIDAGNPAVSLADAMNELASRQRYLACEIQGTRHNVGVKYGLFNAQLAFALSGVDRDRILAELVEQLASTNAGHHPS
jgi:UTP--glucose-1-phosphate uridylyltransferase